MEAYTQRPTRLPVKEIVALRTGERSPEHIATAQRENILFAQDLMMLDVFRHTEQSAEYQTHYLQRMRMTLINTINTFGREFVTECFEEELAELARRRGLSVPYTTSDLIDGRKVSDEDFEFVVRARVGRIEDETQSLQEILPQLKADFLSHLSNAQEGDRRKKPRYTPKRIDEYRQRLDSYDYVITDPLMGKNGGVDYSRPIVLVSHTKNASLNETFSHEARHITAGESGVLWGISVELTKRGLTFTFSGVQTYKWLNEALTEIDAALLYGRPPKAYKQFIQLFTKLFGEGKLPYDLFIKAYDEDIDPRKKGVATAALFARIKEKYGRKLLPNISVLINAIEEHARNSGHSSPQVYESLLDRLIQGVHTSEGIEYIANAEKKDVANPELFLAGLQQV